MMKPENLKSNNRLELLLPRWAIPIVWAVVVLVIQVLLPWVVAKIVLASGGNNASLVGGISEG
jgi:hypothetical protein